MLSIMIIKYVFVIPSINPDKPSEHSHTVGYFFSIKGMLDEIFHFYSTLDASYVSKRGV